MMKLKKNMRDGFTLIELLVVISIIALLVSILLPALGRARDQAKGAVCLSHLKQVALGLTMYVHDNENHLPPYTDGIHDSEDSWTSPDGVVYTQYRRHLLTTEWFKSGPYPGAPRDGDGMLGPYLSTLKDSLGGIMGCPSVPEGPTLVDLTYDGMVGKYPVYHGRTFAQSHYAVTPYPEFGPLKLTKIKKAPSEFIPICESSGICPYIIPPNNDPDDYSTYTPAARHNDHFNACFLDGHADSGTHEELFNNRYFHPTVY